MRLSRILRILQVEEGVIHRGQRLRWIKPSEICRILHILRKLNLIIALLFIQNIFFAQTCKPTRSQFALCKQHNLGFLGQWFNNLQRAALLMSLVECDKILCKFGQQQLVIVNYACGFN